MKFAGNLVYNKLVANLLIYLVSKFHNIWLSSLRVMTVARSFCEVLALWIFQDCQQVLSVLAYFGWEFFRDVKKLIVDNLLRFPESAYMPNLAK